METKGIKSRVLHSVHRLIYRYWVDPLQRRIPDLATIKPAWLRRALLSSALWATNLGRLAITDFRVHVRRLKGAHWSVVYMGAGVSFEELCHVLFPTPPEVENLSRMFLWRVPALAREFANQGELVVCELNQIIRWRLRGAYVFTTPCWIRQVLDLTHPTDDILAGMNQGMRRNIRKMSKQGFSYTLTQEKKDFDLFYHEMYCPYTHKRHGKRATHHDYESLYRQFTRGGLILVKCNQTPICGMLCLTVGDTCEAYQMGVHEDHFDQVGQGANVALWWFMMDWARRNKLQRFDFGASRAQTANGTFNFKRQWGTRVVPERDARTNWIFYAEELPLCLRRHLNEQGFISLVDDRYYRIVLLGSEEELIEPESARERQNALRYGLDGILLIFPQEDGKKSSYIRQLVAKEAP